VTAPAGLSAALAGSYTFERELGRGGMAVVWLARDLRHHRLVALKVLDPELGAALGAERFRREITLAAELQHPHVLPVFDSGEAAGCLWYAMPWVEGESLRDRLRREGRLPVGEAVRLLGEVAGALDYAHRRGVIHRDVKPENILLSDGRAMVADFGIARAIAPSAADPHTATGLSVGTPAYMSPEQALGVRAIDGRTDVYALGCLGYELLAGRPPFTGTTAQAIVAAHLTENPPDLAAVRPDAPAPLAGALVRAMAKDPAARFPTAAAFGAALEAATAELPAPVGGRPAPGVRPRPLVVAGAILALAVLAVLGIRLAGGKRAGTAAQAEVVSLAVLPFVNLGGDSSEAYFADGMAEELTTALARVSGLRVAARSAAFRLRGELATPAEAAGILGVETVLEGTVRRAGDRLRVTARLTGAADGVVLWADRYDRGTGDVFAVQDEITAAIVGALRERLGVAAPPGAGASHGTEDLDAWDLYLKGRWWWEKRGPEGLREAVAWFGRAVERDPDFARGHAGLAMAWVVLPTFAPEVPFDSAVAVARASAERALALDSTLADAHLALAYALKMEWRFAEAEPHFRSALALAPDDPAVRHWYGLFLYTTGRLRESLEQFARARALDPLGTTILSDGAAASYFAGRNAEAMGFIRRSLELDSTKSDTWFVQGLTQARLGQHDSALASLAIARRRGTGLDTRGVASASLRALGRRGGADSVRAELVRDEAAGRATPYDVAIAALAAGDRAAAMGAVRRTVALRQPMVTELSLPCEPLLRPLEGEPEFAGLLARAGMRTCDRP
jgi:serine/threonine-protein kinase